MALLVEVVTEVIRELRHGLVELLLDIVAPVTAGDLLQQFGFAAPDRVAQISQEPLDLVDFDPVEIAVRGREELYDLVLGRHRLALALVERLDQPLSAGGG